MAVYLAMLRDVDISSCARSDARDNESNADNGSCSLPCHSKPLR